MASDPHENSRDLKQTAPLTPEGRGAVNSTGRTVS